MKKILFCLQTLTRGGVEKELLTVLKYLPKDRYDVSVLYFYDSDIQIAEEFQRKGVRLINLNIDTNYHCGSTIHLIRQRIRGRRFLEAAKILVLHGLKKGYSSSIQSQELFPTLEEQYDIALAYNMHAPMVVRYVAQNVKAKRRYVWIHTDCTASGFDPRRVVRYLSVYDLFIGCSEQVTQEFVQCLPEFKSCTITVSNIVDVDEIKEKTAYKQEDIREGEESSTILTVGRYEKEKGYDCAILACRKLINSGNRIKWYAIGWGSQESEMRRMIEECNLETEFIILGKRENPYPYLKACTVYVQPSKFEGFGLVIAEAKVLQKPIVATDFAGAREQLVDHETGSIVPVGDVDKIAEAVQELIESPELQKKYTENLRKISWNNDVEKLLAIF